MLHHHIADLAALPGPVALAIGVFDGIHRGHQEVIREALDHAHQHGGSGVVMTFDPHPLTVLRPEKAPKLLCTTEQKVGVLEAMGIEHVLVCRFDQTLSETDADEFIHALVNSCAPLGFISVGYEWVFGKARAGNIHRLMELGRSHDFAVCGVPSVKVEGRVVSSTLIREAVRKGDLATAKVLLGRDYALQGPVVRGRQLGRQLNFPTANISLQNVELPPDGVYAVRALLRGEVFRGVANLGLRPTVDGAGLARTFEVHLLEGPREEFYGESMDVRLMHYLRAEQKFPGLEALKEQIQKDAAAADALLSA